MRIGTPGYAPGRAVLLVFCFTLLALTGRAFALELTRELALEAGFDEVSTSFVDPAEQFGYFLTSTDPVHVAKVDLATFSLVDSMALQPGESNVEVAVVDPSGQFAYLATNDSDARIIRIDLENFARHDHVELSAEFSNLRVGFVSPDGAFAYFATDSNPGYLIRVDLDSFLVDDSIEFSGSEVDFRATAIDPAGDHAYLVSGQSGVLGPPPAATVVKVNLGSFERVDSLSLGGGEYWIDVALIDPAGQKLWLATGTSPGRVVEIDLESFSRAASLELPAELGRPRSGMLSSSGEYAYLGTSLEPAQVAKVDLERLIAVRSVETDSSIGRLYSALPRPVAGKLYFGTDKQPARIAEFSTDAPELRFQARTLNFGDQLATFYSPARELTITNSGTEPVVNLQFELTSDHFELVANDCHPSLAVGDSCSIEVTFVPQVGERVEATLHAIGDQDTYTEVAVAGRGVDRPGFALSDGVVNGPGLFAQGAGFLRPNEDQAVYVTRESGSIHARSVDLGTLDYIEHFAFLGHEEGVGSAVGDSAGNYAYFGIEPARIVRLDLHTFDRAGNIDIPSAKGGVRASAIDPDDAFGYFATSGDPARIIKVRLSTFQIENVIEYSDQPGGFLAGFMDSAGEHIYFTFEGEFGARSLVRVETQPFEVDDELPLLTTPFAPVGVMVDADDRYAYVYDFSWPPRLSRIDLTTFTLAGYVEIGESPGTFQAGAVDPAGEFIYMAVDGAPSRLYRISQSELEVLDHLQLSEVDEWTLPSTALVTADGGFGYVTHDDELIRLALSAPILRFEPALLAVDLDNSGRGPVSETVVIFNQGRQAATGLIFESFEEGISASKDSCTGSLESGQSCTIEVTYDPQLIGSEALSLHANTDQNAAARLDVMDADAVMIFRDDFTVSASGNWK